MNFTTSASKILVVIESFPEVEQRLVARLRTSIEQNANFRVQNTAEGIEKPSVRVDLLAVLLLETEHHLHRRKSARAIIRGSDELLVRGDRELGGVLKLLLVSKQIPVKMFRKV